MSGIASTIEFWSGFDQPDCGAIAPGCNCGAQRSIAAASNEDIVRTDGSIHNNRSVSHNEDYSDA